VYDPEQPPVSTSIGDEYKPENRRLCTSTRPEEGLRTLRDKRRLGIVGDPRGRMCVCIGCTVHQLFLTPQVYDRKDMLSCTRHLERVFIHLMFDASRVDRTNGVVVHAQPTPSLDNGHQLERIWYVHRWNDNAIFQG
jgi:hypothetical protein